MKRVMVEHIIFNKEEREIIKSWGSDWRHMRKELKQTGVCHILVGTWSGYTSGQSRICHTEYVPQKHVAGIVLRQIVFTDGTTLDIVVKPLSLEMILLAQNQAYKRRAQYDELVRRARGEMEEIYYIEPKQQYAAKNNQGERGEAVAHQHEGTDGGGSVRGPSSLDQGEGDPAADSGPEDYWNR